jgi:hypothetical protein
MDEDEESCDQSAPILRREDADARA